MLIDFRLKVFNTVARELSFTKAARELNISQPAITKHIKELEASVGESLFTRQGNRISLTSKGEQITPFVASILEDYQKLNDIIDSQRNDFSGEINIGVSTTILQYLIPQIVAKFTKTYPNISLRLTSGNSEEIADLVFKKRLDFAIVEGATTDPSFHYEHLSDDTIILVSRIKHLSPIEIKDLRKYPLVIRENGSGTLAVIEKNLTKHNISRRALKIAVQIGSSEAIIRYLLNSNSYAFISKVAVEDYLEQERLHEVKIEDFEIKREFRFMSLHGKSSRLCELFKNFCLNCID